jgi:predicted DCC family thiol-disulfide oxidoreductase YuxK
MLTLLLYDGECAFCHWSVKLVAKFLKPRSGVKFAPLQGETATRLRADGLDIPSNLDSMCFIVKGQVWQGPFAFYAVAKLFSWPWSCLAWGRILPARFSWWAYSLVARNRFRIFGKTKSTCIFPTAEQRASQLP